jgi:hypothetical protein
MNTTDNTNISADDELHKDSPNNDNGKTQAQIDREERARLVKAEVSAPVSESQVQPGQEVVDGNGRRDTPTVEPTRPDILVDKEAVTQSKVDRLDQEQRDHAHAVQDKQNKKLNQNTKPGEDAPEK